jgi:hypothetical protein
MFEVSPVTDLGRVWQSLYSLTRDGDFVTASAVHKAQRGENPVSEPDVGAILMNSWERRTVEAFFDSTAGVIKFRVRRDNTTPDDVLEYLKSRVVRDDHV